MAINRTFDLNKIKPPTFWGGQPVRPHRWYKRIQETYIPQEDIDQYIALTRVASKLMDSGRILGIDMYKDMERDGWWHMLVKYSHDTKIEDCVDDTV